MRYNPLEPLDSNIPSEVVMLSVDVSVTHHANTNVLVKDIKVEMGGGTVTPLQDIQQTILRRYDVLTLLYRYERFGGEGGRRTVSTCATMIPLLSDSEETSPKIVSLWNKVLDIPSLNTAFSSLSTRSQRAVSQIMTPPSSARNSPKPGMPAKSRATQVRASDVPSRTMSPATVVPSQPSNLSITVQVPHEGVNPQEEFTVDIQVVNRSTRPMKLALFIDSGQTPLRSQQRISKTDKLLPRVPLTSTGAQSSDRPGSNVMTEVEARDVFLREQETKKGKPIVSLTVEIKIGYLLFLQS